MKWTFFRFSTEQIETVNLCLIMVFKKFSQSTKHELANDRFRKTNHTEGNKCLQNQEQWSNIDRKGERFEQTHDSTSYSANSAVVPNFLSSDLLNGWHPDRLNLSRILIRAHRARSSTGWFSTRIRHFKGIESWIRQGNVSSKLERRGCRNQIKRAFARLRDKQIKVYHSEVLGFKPPLWPSKKNLIF